MGGDYLIMALTKISTDGFKDDAVTTDKLANAINTERTANTAKDLTALSASNLTSGTVPDARFPATLPAKSAANLTNIPAANITGTLPAISGANLTDLPASGKATNLVINGAMNVAQRGTSSTSSGYQTIDRFLVMFDSGLTEAPTQSQISLTSSDTPYALGFRNAFRITNGNQSSQDANDYVLLRQKIEAQNMACSGWNYTSASSYVTLSFWVKASVAQTMYVRLLAEDSPGGEQYSFAFSATTSWTKITKTIPGASGVVFNNDNGTGLNLHIIPFYGTSYTTSSHTNDVWEDQDGADQLPDMANTWFSVNDATFDVTGVQLEVGDTASDFAHESFQDTLLKCYRYLYAHKGMLWGITSAGDHLDLNITYPVPMRTTPSRTQVDTSLLFKNRLDQENSTSTNTYSYPGAISPTGDFWVARPGSGDAWGVSYTSSDTHAVYWHPHEGTVNYLWSAEL